MLHKICFFCLFCASLFSIDDVYLKTPDLSRENIIGTNVGIRPFRKSGVRLEAEYFRDKLVIHNYGYGGSGLTLSFGGSKEVLDLLDHYLSPSKTIAVVGAGVVGLATAYDLLAQGYEVHLYSDQWTPNLTSNVAAGIWTPLTFPDDIPEEKQKLHERMLETAHQRFLKSTTEAPEFAGVRFIDCYGFKIDESKEKQREEVVVHFDNGIIKEGWKFSEVGIDGQLFMEDLYSKVKTKGAVLEERHFENLEDLLSLEEPVIINCTSMGSIQLFDDQDFVPLRGQIVYFKPQEGIDCLLYQGVDHDPDDSNLFFVSIYPWSDRLILGGVYEKNEKEPIINLRSIDRIIENGQECLSNN